MDTIRLFGKNVVKSLTRAAIEMQTAFNDIDFNDFENRFVSIQNEIKKEIEKLTKKLNEEYVVEVPYDRDTQTLSYRIENRIMTITVERNENTDNSFLKSKDVTTITIPKYVNIDKITQNYLKDENMMIFIFKKGQNEEEGTISENEPTVNNDNDDNKNNKIKLMEKMYHMRKNGCSYRQIGLECGLSDKTVKKWINAYLVENGKE